MRSAFQKLGFVVSAAAVLFLSFFLPLHRHDKNAINTQTAHCSVCDFSKEGKTADIVSAFSEAPILQEIPTSPKQNESDFLLFSSTISQRAPPAS